MFKMHIYCKEVPSPAKGQLISKVDWRAIDSPKKRMDEFVLFAFLLFTNQICPFVFWENLRRANLLFGSI